MASVPIATVSDVEQLIWDIPNPVPVNGVARGEVLFTTRSGIVIPARAADDTQIWTLTCNFPRNFQYRMLDLSITATYIDDATLVPVTGFEIGMMVDIRSNAGLANSQLDTQIMWNQAFAPLKLAGGGFGQVGIRFSDSTDSRESVFSMNPMAPSTRLIDASDNASIFVRWIDENFATATRNAVTMQWFIRALQYTQEQARNFRANSPNALTVTV